MEQRAKRIGGIPVEFFGYPKQVQNLANKLVNYDIPFPSSFALRYPIWTAAIDAASMLDPDFNAQIYPARYAAIKDFTSGNNARNLRSIDTAIKHLDSLRGSSKALNNTQIPLLNSLENYIIEQAGDPRPNNYNERADAVAQELTSVFRGTNGSLEDVRRWRSRLSQNMSPEGFKGAIDGAIDLLAGRIEALHSAWQRAYMSPADFKFFSDNARKTIASLGYDPDALDNGAMVKLDQSRKKQANPVTYAPGSPAQPGSPEGSMVTKTWNPQTGKME